MRHRSGLRGSSAALYAAFGIALLGGVAVADDNETSVAQACLNHPSIRRTKVLDSQNILFVTRDDQTYHNQLPRECPTMRRNALLNYNIVNKELCAGNRFAVLWQVGTSWIPGFVCELGMFRPVSEDEVKDLMALTENEPRKRRSGRAGSVPAPIETEVVELPQEEAAAPAESPAPAQPAP
jgi:hypothetical protein